MEQVYKFVVREVLCAVLRGDTQIIEQLREFGGDVCFRDGDLHFTLPALFNFALQHCKASAHSGTASWEVGYKAFRRLLYRNPTNAMLKKCGGAVEIENTHDDHARSVYKLVRIADGKSS
jgi:hypothetical protein